jgi:ribosomal protein L37E
VVGGAAAVLAVKSGMVDSVGKALNEQIHGRIVCLRCGQDGLRPGGTCSNCGAPIPR